MEEFHANSQRVFTRLGHCLVIVVVAVLVLVLALVLALAIITFLVPGILIVALSAAICQVVVCLHCVVGLGFVWTSVSPEFVIDISPAGSSAT
jgi:hypothetical protein